MIRNRVPATAPSRADAGCEMRGSRQHLTGIGDTAFFRNNRDRHAGLMVWTGPYHFTIQLDVPTGGTAESIKPKAIGLATAIISKLR